MAYIVTNAKLAQRAMLVKTQVQKSGKQCICCTNTAC